MYITKARFVRFGAHVDRTLDFRTDRGDYSGLFGLIGPNGSGKSTLVNGIHACLTNDFSRFKGVKSDNICDTEPKGLESYVEIEAVQNDIPFRVRVSLCPEKVELWEGDAAKPVVGATKVTAAINRLMAVHPSLWPIYVFVPQGRINQMLAMGNTERAQVFARLCGLEKAETIAKAADAVLKQDVFKNKPIPDTTLPERIKESELSVARWMLEIRNVEEKFVRWTQKSQSGNWKRRVEKYKKYAHAAEGYKELKHCWPVHVQVLREGEKQLDEYCTKLVSLDEVLATQIRLGNEYAAWRARFNNRQAFADSAAAKTLEVARHEAKVLEHIGREPKWSTLGVASEDELARRTAKLQEERAVYVKDLNDARGVVQKFVTEGSVVCPVCGTSATSLDQHIAEAESLVESLPGVVDQYDTDIERAAELVRQHRAWAVRLQTLQKDVSSVREVLGRIEGNLAALPEVGVFDSSEMLADPVLKTLREDRDATEKLRKALERNVIKDREIMVINRRNKLDIEEVLRANRGACTAKQAKRFERWLLRGASLSASLPPMRNALAEARHTLAQRKESLVKQEAALAKYAKVRRAQDMIERIGQVFHPRNLPAKVSQAALIRMEGKINENLDQFGGKFWVEASKDLDFRVHFPGCPVRSTQRLSGGQCSVLGLSLTFTGSNLFCKELGFMALDEPSDNLDKTNRTFLKDALIQLAGSLRGHRQCLVVTHHEELEEAFDKTFDLTKE